MIANVKERWAEIREWFRPMKNRQLFSGIVAILAALLLVFPSPWVSAFAIIVVAGLRWIWEDRTSEDRTKGKSESLTRVDKWSSNFNMAVVLLASGALFAGGHPILLVVAGLALVFDGSLDFLFVFLHDRESLLMRIEALENAVQEKQAVDHVAGYFVNNDTGNVKDGVLVYLIALAEQSIKLRLAPTALLNLIRRLEDLESTVAGVEKLANKANDSAKTAYDRAKDTARLKTSRKYGRQIRALFEHLDLELSDEEDQQ